jgi:agmatinase
MRTFAGISEEFAKFDTASVILQGISYDGTSTWGKGADMGFEAFLDAAENMELYDIETDSEVYRKGIFLADTLDKFKSPEEMFHKVYQNSKELIDTGKFLSFIGGEHSISIGIIKAMYEHYDDLTVLQIDAHADLRPEYEGTPYNHACAMHDARYNTNLIQLGIRSMDVSEKAHMDYERCFFAHKMALSRDWIDKSIALMTDRVYLSFDLDAFDSGIMPSTGTPEPGGLDWYTVMQYLSRVFSEKEVVGFDIVELAPINGLHASPYLLSKMYYKLLSYKFFPQGSL